MLFNFNFHFVSRSFGISKKVMVHIDAASYFLNLRDSHWKIRAEAICAEQIMVISAMELATLTSSDCDCWGTQKLCLNFNANWDWSSDKALRVSTQLLGFFLM